jgi:hypothetical protein
VATFIVDHTVRRGNQTILFALHVISKAPVRLSAHVLDRLSTATSRMTAALLLLLLKSRINVLVHLFLNRLEESHSNSSDHDLRHHAVQRSDASRDQAVCLAKTKRTKGRITAHAYLNESASAFLDACWTARRIEGFIPGAFWTVVMLPLEIPSTTEEIDDDGRPFAKAASAM